MSWLSPPPVVVISGDEDFLRRREIQKALAGAARTGRRVEYIKGSDTQHLSRVLASGSVLFKDKTLAIVLDADKVNVELVLNHHKRKSSKVALVLTQEGEIKKKGNLTKVVGEIPKNLHLQFKSLPPWKQSDQAVTFLVKEANGFQLRLSEKMATVMVAAAGEDLGILWFELHKLSALLHSLEDEKPEEDRAAKPEVQAGHLRQTLSTLTQVGGIPVVDALGAADPRRLARSMSAMRRTHTGDPTMKACALISRNVTQWLHAAALLSQNAGVDEIALRLQLHPYVCKTKVLPVAKKWGERNLAGLLTAIAAVERGVRSGHVNSWVELETALLRVVLGRTRAVA